MIRLFWRYNAYLPIGDLDIQSRLLSLVWKHGKLYVLVGIDDHPASQAGCQNPAPASFSSAVCGDFNNYLEDESSKNITVLRRDH